MFIVLLCVVFIVNVLLKSIQPLLLLISIYVDLLSRTTGARNSFAERRLYRNHFRINRQGCL